MIICQIRTSLNDITDTYHSLNKTPVLLIFPKIPSQDHSPLKNELEKFEASNLHLIFISIAEQIVGLLAIALVESVDLSEIALGCVFLVLDTQFIVAEYDVVIIVDNSFGGRIQQLKTRPVRNRKQHTRFV
jgi:hypothetical protein